MSWQRYWIRNHAVPLSLKAMVMVPLVAVSFYWTATESGLYGWLWDWELQLLDQVNETVLGLATFILMVVAGLAIIQVVGAVRARERSGTDLAHQHARDDETARRMWAWGDWAARALGAILCLSPGLYFIWSGLSSGPITPLDVATLEKDERPASRYVEVSGRVLEPIASTTSTGNNAETSLLYLPVVSDGWSPGQPIRVYLRSGETALGQPLRGTLHENGLPRLVRTILARQGTPPADRYWMLAYGTPHDDVVAGIILLICGVVVGAAVAIGSWHKSRPLRRAR